MSAIEIRVAAPSDIEDVAGVCRLTADAGHPQPADVADPELVADVYARPYLVLEPRTARVLLADDVVVGYVVGALDSPSFYRRWQQVWTPTRLPRPEGADPALVALLARPLIALPDGLRRYPSHLHVNLLPHVRGGGNGAALLAAFMDGLAQAGSTGVHLRVDPANTTARQFYERLGFQAEGEYLDALVMVRALGS
jgi:GNAT superfamily N-acetyltransferase